MPLLRVRVDRVVSLNVIRLQCFVNLLQHPLQENLHVHVKVRSKYMYLLIQTCHDYFTGYIESSSNILL